MDIQKIIDKNWKIMILFVVLMIIGIFYNRYQEKLAREEGIDNKKAIQDYLMWDPSSLSESKKPIMWIPIQYEYNARNWQSFGSRSSLELNQPYLYLTVDSILKQCDNSFRICIIDDSSFDMLLPGWSIDMSSISKPITKYIRHLGLAKLVHLYGGMIVPPSFLCMRDLYSLFEGNTQNNKMFVCENIDRNSTSVDNLYYPDINFMGSNKDTEIMKRFIEFMEQSISQDYTAEMEFLGQFNRWCDHGIKENQINMVNGKMIGIKTEDDTPVLVDNLLSNDYIEFTSNLYGIYIPANEILSRRHYQWFARLSQKQVLESNVIIGKYILLANSPDAQDGGLIEGMDDETDKKSKNWIKYWRVPSDAPVWGLKPNYLGNNLIGKKSPPKVN
jgi:hypothetical protein|tara:strand:+ start:1248 stop:2411 length:1164 start_codon:yes stop_codon:yes gene_type:complete